MNTGLIPALISPVATPEYVAQFGSVAEALGFHSIWLGEHVVLFDEYEANYPYSDDGRVPAGGENGFLETFTALTYLAASTRTIRLGSGVCLVPQRNPVYTAKEAAAVDWLSGGRLDFGVGVGWQREEFEAVSMPFERRGARCNSYVKAIQRLWCDPISEYHDEFYNLEPCRMYPKPIQDPHPPIYFGGESDAALRRVAELGQGWYGLGITPDDLPPLLAKLEKFLAEKGRGLADIEVAVSPYFKGCDRDNLERYRDLGVDQVIVPGLVPELGISLETIEPSLERLAKELVEPALSF